jgi:hypothetical protein
MTRWCSDPRQVASAIAKQRWQAIGRPDRVHHCALTDVSNILSLVLSYLANVLIFLVW